MSYAENFSCDMLSLINKFEKLIYKEPNANVMLYS
jgi:hypothetical protein